MAGKTGAIRITRRITLGVSLAGLTAMTILHQFMPGVPSIDALDPFGGLETLMKLVGGGGLIQKIEPGTIVLFGGVVVLGIVASRFFCGWFCAFGALQGVFGWLGKKLLKRRPSVPAKLDKVLRFLKYPVLAVVLWLTWTTASLVIRPYDPVAAYGHLAAGFPALWAEFGVGLGLLAATLVLSALYDRAFCKYLCPLGAFLALLSRVPFFRIRRNASTCIACGKCDKACMMGVDVSRPAAVASPECIGCLECVAACPTKPKSLATTFARRAAAPALAAAIGIAIYVGAALAGQLSGARLAAPGLAEQAASGVLSVEDIKGSSTYASVLAAFGIDAPRLYAELGLDPAEVPVDAMIKDTAKLAGLPSFEATLVRAAVARVKGLPYAGGEEAGGATTTTEAAPTPATSAPSATSSLPPGTKAPASPPAAPATKPASATAGTAAPSSAAGNPSFSVPPDFALEGTMTVAQIASTLGVAEEAVIAKLGLPADFPRDKALRDLKDRYGYTLPELKARFK